MFCLQIRFHLVSMVQFTYTTPSTYSLGYTSHCLYGTQNIDMSFQRLHDTYIDKVSPETKIKMTKRYKSDIQVKDPCIYRQFTYRKKNTYTYIMYSSHSSHAAHDLNCNAAWPHPMHIAPARCIMLLLPTYPKPLQHILGVVAVCILCDSKSLCLLSL